LIHGKKVYGLHRVGVDITEKYVNSGVYDMAVRIITENVQLRFPNQPSEQCDRAGYSWQGLYFSSHCLGFVLQVWTAVCFHGG